MNKQEMLKFLKNNPVFWSRLGFSYDPPRRGKDGKPIVFTPDLTEDSSFHRDFTKAGVKIHTNILHLGWMGVDDYDYSVTDAVLEEIFKNDNVYYIPRIKLNVPVDWCRENPEDIFVYWEGPRGAEEIRSLVDTPKHDWFGYTAPKGYYKAGDYIDDRPNVGGTVSRQSFSSEKWLRDAGEALRRLVDRLENGKYADRIIGYHIAFGVSGEAILWGRADYHYGDYGIKNTENFYAWAEKKYGSKEALLKAWDADLTLPSPDERYSRFDKTEEFLRGDRIGRVSRDMDEFTSHSCASAIEHFSRIIKEFAPDKLIGAFYGYFMHTDNPNYAGHLELQRLLDGDLVDFFAAPKIYHRCGPGEPGGEMCPVQSVNLKKLWVDEADNRTHLASDDVPAWLCRDMDDTRWVMWRELSKNISHDSGFWWMDLGGRWFKSPEIMKEITHMLDVSSYLRTLPHKSPADALILVDEKCIYSMGISKDLRLGFMEDFVCEVRKSGIIADVYRLSDIRSLDLSRYKLIVFAYTFEVSEEDRKYLDEHISKDAVLSYHWAAGAIKDGKVTLENVNDFTGFNVFEGKRDKYDFPKLCVKNAEAFSDKGYINGKRILFTEPFITHSEIRRMGEMAGCRLCVDSGLILYADNRITGVFSKEKLTGSVKLSGKTTWREEFSGKVFEETDEISLEQFNSNIAVFIRN